MDHEELESLRRDMQLLADRVSRLETTLGSQSAEPASAARTGIQGPPPPGPAGQAVAVPYAFLNTQGAVSILGKALLGVAGAYLLRALTETGTLPMGFGVALGIAYSAAWLALAARFSSTNRLAAMMYGWTSVLVLTPLLWEATARFQAIQTWVAAATLSAFTILGLAISWRGNLTHIAWIATLGGVVTSAALLLATHDIIPFTCVFLAIAGAVEISAFFEHWLRERLLVALMLDVGVVLMTWMATLDHGLPEGYPAMPSWAVILIQAALVGIYLISAMARTLWLERSFTNVEILQCALAFTIGVGGALRVGKGNPRIAVAFAIFTLIAGATSYFAGYQFLERRQKHGRNFYVYSTFGLLLTISGAGILLSGPQLGALLPLAAIACIWIAGRYNRTTLLWHGVFYILLGAFLSEALPDALRLLLTHASGVGAIGPAAWIGAAGTLACCMLLSRYPAPQPVVVLITLAAALVSSGIIAGVLTGLAPSAYGSNLRTAVLLGAAVILAWTSRSKAVYALMLLAAYKLLTQDLVDDRTPALVVSLFLYGATLLLLPRLMPKSA